MGSGMTSTCTRNLTDSDRQQSVSNDEGARVQRSFRGVLRSKLEDEADDLRDAFNKDLASTGYTDEQVEERTPVDRAQLSRIRNGKAHPPFSLVVWVIDNSRISPPAIVRAICGVAEGEFKPRPPPSVEDRHAATMTVLREMGIADVVVEKAMRLTGDAR
jgi:hypothetical protein